jgi:hypothetical protein
MKHFKTVFLVTAIIIAFAVNAFPQMFAVGQSSEWDATAFNNGRRVVRDCSMPGMGYYHYVWHSRPNPALPPSAGNCDIMYACFDDLGNTIIGAFNLTQTMGFADNRYPSIAIESAAIDVPGVWRGFNTLHVVWQCKQAAGANYEIMYGSIAVASPPAGPVALAGVQNLSQTPARHSLVPAIDINHHGPLGPGMQHIHVVWQEEHVFHPAAGVFASDIFYTRSVNSGLNFMGPTTGGLWDNITNTPRDSQMPSIACAIDIFQGFPLDYTGFDCVYPTDDVHVAYNENTAAGGIHVYYLQNTVDGNPPWWAAVVDVTAAMGGGAAALNGYPSISSDMLDNVHIVYMNNVGPHSPFATGYRAGLDPLDIRAFPGPNPGMYNGLLNNIVYWSNNLGANPLPALAAGYDREFPTVALDRDQNVSVNWQECQVIGGGVGDYQVMREYCFNLNAPARPPAVPNYAAWALGPNNDSIDPPNDDLFPNLAHKKVSMYLIFVPPFPGFTEAWNKVIGTGRIPCMAAFPKHVHTLSNTARDAAVN